MEADIIIAGGGTAACVIACRLGEAFPSLDILIVESGVDNRDDTRVLRPLELFQLYKGDKHIRYIKGNSSEHLGGRQPTVPVGTMLGGSSSINFMLYNNAAASDFDDWNQPGWSYAELQPFIRRTETYAAKDEAGVHGTDGPTPVSYGGHQNPYAEEYFKAFDDVWGLPRVNDLADYKTAHGCGYFAKLISGKNGYRSNAAHNYLYERGHCGPGERSNIRVVKSKTVNRVLFDGDRAIGVEVSDTYPDETPTQMQTISARKLVLICAGAFGTPMILERSGVGDRAVLDPLGIPVKVDLPGVGREYQDHQLTICSYRVKEGTETLDDYPREGGTVKQRSDQEWERTGKGITATNGMDYGFKIRPTPRDIQSMGPVFEEHWKSVGGDVKLDKPLYSGPFLPYFMGPTERPATGNFVSMGAFSNYPASRGHVHITSTDPLAPPSFDAGLLNHPADLPVHVWAYKLQREVARRLPFVQAEHVPSHPIFPATSSAACGTLFGGRSLTYREEDDQAIETWVRKNVGTAYHSMSTCPMRSREDYGVVDAKLNVYGVRGLKIADLSICPSNLGTNTTTVALIIGERAADIIAREL